MQLLSAEERASKTKVVAKTAFEQALQAYEQRDFDSAARLAERRIQPNQTSHRPLICAGRYCWNSKSTPRPNGSLDRLSRPIRNFARRSSIWQTFHSEIRITPRRVIDFRRCCEANAGR